MKQPREITELIAFLEGQGFILSRKEGPDPNYFGYIVMEYSDGRVKVLIEWERSVWIITMVDIARPDIWYDAIMLRDLILGVGPTDELSLAEQVSIVKAIWQDVVNGFSPSRRDATHAQLARLRDEFDRRALPAWPDAVVELELFLIERGLTCVHREAPEGTKGPRLMQYADDVISVRITCGAPGASEGWRVRIADSARPDTWYDISLIRSLLEERDDFRKALTDCMLLIWKVWVKLSAWEDRRLPKPRDFEFVKEYWTLIRREFSDERREATHARLRELMREKTGT